jgi:pimeloyl-ACP methyl ester carboxylesterase/class 3 adenylate cyclase
MAEHPDDRRIVAILFTDIVGYTALTERDESAAIRVRERHRTLLRTLAAQFEGELIDATGDEALATFPSALLAVDCALALQAALRDDRELALRIGIHLGDVARRGGEVIGEGVNVAARIRPLAEPGGICVSEPVYQMVRSRGHIHATSLGAQALKNVSVPLNVFALSSATGAAAPARSRRRLAWAAGIALALIAAAVFAWTQYRVPILAAIAIAAPRYFSSPVEQQIGFATASDGVRIAYATSGEGPPVVFVLGWGTHLEKGIGSPLYDPVGWIARLSEHNRLIRYDGRGFGLSERNVSDFSLDARRRDLEAVVDALGIERFAIYGISAGGAVATTYAARHPERVTRLILVAANAGVPSVPNPRFTQEQFTGIVEVMRTGWNTPEVRDMWVSVLRPEIDDVNRRVVNEFLRLSADGAAMSGFFSAYVGEDFGEELAQIRVPTLVIHGDLDVTVPLASGVRLASLIPAARFEILKGADHVSTQGDSRTLQLIEDFLAEGDPAASAK